jgi:hypothetical protein
MFWISGWILLHHDACPFGQLITPAAAFDREANLFTSSSRFSGSCILVEKTPLLLHFSES